MTTPTASPPPCGGAEVPCFSVAGAFLEGLATRDFERLGSALCHDVHLRALLPRRLVECHGAGDVTAAFVRWFGDAVQFELVEAVIGEVGTRLHLRWRVRLQSERLGDGWFVVEQLAYADTGESDRIQQLSLLCSGYCPEGEG